MSRNQTVYNFNPGPATLPKEVMVQAQEEFTDYRGLGYGIVEASHRGEAFKDVLARTEQNVRELLEVPEEYAVLFLQGGASLQFAMVPMNLMMPGRPAVYADTGAWTAKAIKEAKLFGDVEIVFSGKEAGYACIGDPQSWEVRSDASYLYICSNNTIRGTQYHFFPDGGGVPLVADMSSDIMSRPLDIARFGLIFAGAQKNLGPAGVTLVVLRKDLLARTPEGLTAMLRYGTHVEKDSCFNTPPVFAIYMLGLVTDWLKGQGGLAAVERINTVKSQTLYEMIDSTTFYQGTAEAGDRSKMNITFRLPNPELEALFVKEAAENGLIGLKGHRSVGGIRASCYNAMPLAGISCLVDFMTEFEARHG
ncbi:MAG: 3-phosphoserine/phosphohydroxythreonine transaminase [Kiritimatiellaeota bacterium]|nr:3-phosphoserine/phosphohydroxythreonine transaminase [Kiritimatiellota bacterium]